MVAKYAYSLRAILRDRKELGKMLEDLGEDGWEVVSILETTLRTNMAGWLIVSKRISAPSDQPLETVPATELEVRALHLSGSS